MTAIILETNTETYSIISHNISLPRDSTPSISWSKSNRLVHPKTIYAPQASHILWRSPWVCVVGPQVDQLMIQHCLYFILVLYILRHEKQACFLQFLIIQPHNHSIFELLFAVPSIVLPFPYLCSALQFLFAPFSASSLLDGSLPPYPIQYLSRHMVI